MAVNFFQRSWAPVVRNFVSCRSYSSAALVDVKVDETKGFAVVSMNKPPVNSLSLEMIQSLSQTVAELEKNKCKGLILTSASPTIFSAGLDIKEMYQPQEERLRNFWTSLQGLWLQLYGSKMATVALINGHSPAGGCLLAMSCDYRVMVGGKFKIGLNETKLGIVAPPWFRDTMINTVGVRQTELALQLGTLFSSEEALKIGMVDEVASDLASATDSAESKLKEFLQIPATARYLSKMSVREPTLKALVASRQDDTDKFVSFAQSAPVQKGLGMYLASLSKKN